MQEITLKLSSETQEEIKKYMNNPLLVSDDILLAEAKADDGYVFKYYVSNVAGCDAPVYFYGKLFDTSGKKVCETRVDLYPENDYTIFLDDIPEEYCISVIL